MLEAETVPSFMPCSTALKSRIASCSVGCCAAGTGTLNLQQRDLLFERRVFLLELHLRQSALSALDRTRGTLHFVFGGDRLFPYFCHLISPFLLFIIIYIYLLFV